MKVDIGPYKNWIGPYQISNMIFFWQNHSHFIGDETRFDRWDYKLNDRFGDWLASTWVGTLCQWVDSKKKRKVKIKIHNYDTWSMDHTLSLIILPMLKQLKETKHGSPHVDPEDVPENLRPDPKRVKMHKKGEIEEWEIDNTVHERWSWVLDEMIYSFECGADEDWDTQFYSGTHDIHWKELDNGMSQMVKGENDTFTVDREAMNKAWDRRKNGLKLFGKYFHGLWD